MTKELVAMMLEEARIGVDELAGNCAVDRAWVVEYVQAGILLEGVEPDPARWTFNVPGRRPRSWPPPNEMGSTLARGFLDRTYRTPMPLGP